MAEPQAFRPSVPHPAVRWSDLEQRLSRAPEESQSDAARELRLARLARYEGLQLRPGTLACVGCALAAALVLAIVGVTGGLAQKLPLVLGAGVVGGAIGRLLERTIDEAGARARVELERRAVAAERAALRAELGDLTSGGEGRGEERA